MTIRVEGTTYGTLPDNSKQRKTSHKTINAKRVKVKHPVTKLIFSTSYALMFLFSYHFLFLYQSPSVTSPDLPLWSAITTALWLSAYPSVFIVGFLFWGFFIGYSKR